ncbi:MAG: aminotransferase class I/II-fold pyridoxal phosphate-dependent enzyme [Planctomycetota bacterium]|jgi:LL-diaminopimelate aminotransferase
MAFHVASRIRSLPAYPFAVLTEKVAELRRAGIEPVDFGVGDPTLPTPRVVRERLKAAVDERAASGYPSYVGSPEFRAAAAAWIERTFGVALDPATQVTSTIGSKEGIFNFPLGFVEPGDLVLCPSPGYPPYPRGTLFAGATPHFLPLLRENRYLPDLDAIPADVAGRARILWLCYPNAPTGVLAPPEFFRKAIAWGRARDVVIVNDEAYIDLCYGGVKARSLLEFGAKGVVSFFSMSKRSAMTGWRIGWTAGDRDIISVFRNVKTNIDSGTPTFIQDAAIAGLEDETHVAEMRADYEAKRDLLAAAFRDLGLDDCAPAGTIHYWQRLPDGVDPVTFAQRLLDPEIAVVCTPGPWIADECAGGVDPGAHYVRFSMVPSQADTRRACDALRAHREELLG